MSSKQAELRRLMKLQREKKQRQEQETSVQQTIPKANPPKSILRSKSERNNHSEKQEPPDHRLASLLTAYYSDDSDHDESTNDSKNDPQSTEKQKTARSVSWPEDNDRLETTHVIAPAASKSEESSAIHIASRDPSALRDTTRIVAVSTPSTTIQEDGARFSRLGPQHHSEPTNANDDYDEKWREFEALLGDDNTTESVGIDGGTSSTSVAAAHPVAQLENAAVAASAKVETNPKEEEEAPSTAEVEQVSYEARIAKLRLKAMQRRKKKALQNDEAALSNVATDYTPELAYQEEETVGGKRSAEDASLSPLEILRQKRARERELAKRDDEEYY